MRQARRIGLCLVLVFSSADAAFAQLTGPLADAMRQACPSKRLAFLNPGILGDGVDAFRERLPPRLRARVEAAARPGLATCEFGSPCVNGAYIRAAGQLGLTSRLAKAVCELPYACTAPFECSEVTRRPAGGAMVAGGVISETLA